MISDRYRGVNLTLTPLGEIVPSGRLNPAYFEKHYLEVDHKLRELQAVPLGQFIPEFLPDGSRGITYGQVGARKLDPRGAVRYLQVINIRDTGIDFAIKPDRVAEKSYNDPPRSRVQLRDILFTNNAFRGTDTLLGRCVVISHDYGKMNVSQHIDRIRVVRINPFYVGCFLKSRFGTLQFQRVMHGVDSSGISFGRIRAILVPNLPADLQHEIERQYLEMSRYHDRAMAIKERLLADKGIQPGQFGEAINALAEEKPAYKRAMLDAKNRLQHLLKQVEAVIEGQQTQLSPFPN